MYYRKFFNKNKLLIPKVDSQMSVRCTYFYQILNIHNSTVVCFFYIFLQKLKNETDCECVV